MVGVSIFVDKENGRELIYRIVGKNKQLIDHPEGIEEVKATKEYLDLKFFLNDLRSKGLVHF